MIAELDAVVEDPQPAEPSGALLLQSLLELKNGVVMAHGYPQPHRRYRDPHTTTALLVAPPVQHGISGSFLARHRSCRRAPQTRPGV